MRYHTLLLLLLTATWCTSCLPGGTGLHLDQEEERFHKAASRQNTRAIQALLGNEHLDLNSQDNAGRTALMKVLNTDFPDHVVEITNLLLRSGVDVNLQNNKGWTALMVAAARNHAAVLPLLLAHDAAINHQEPTTGLTALLLAVQHRHLESLNALLNNRHINPNLRCHNGYTALLLAATRNRPLIIRALLDHAQADTTLRTPQGYSPLLCAAASGFSTVFKAILTHPRAGCTAEELGLSLLIAARRGHVSIVRALCKQALQPVDGQLAYMLAAQGHHGSITQALQRYGSLSADALTQAFIQAAAAGQVIRLRLLLPLVPDLNVQNRHGETALMLAAYGGHRPAVELLLKHGARPDIRSKADETAQMLASARGHARIASMLSPQAAPVAPSVVPATSRQAPPQAEPPRHQAPPRRRQPGKKKRNRKRRSQRGNRVIITNFGDHNTFGNITINQNGS